MAKCSECGFLALRNSQTQNLDEVAYQYRDKWEKPIGDFNHPSNPICFVRRFNLWDETKSRGDENVERKQDVFTVISKERPCGDSFTNWQQGFTPKEHREMMDRTDMLKYQAEREDADKQFRLKMATDDKKWQSQQQIRLVVIAGIFTIIGAIIGAIIMILR